MRKAARGPLFYRVERFAGWRRCGVARCGPVCDLAAAAGFIAARRASMSRAFGAARGAPSGDGAHVSGSA
ncbi:hypothetical protein [Burkholderia oklahomensis]|nr:hypothetical protein [Burkholderia oklahomensis]